MVHRYCPLWEFTPWTMITTAFGESAFFERRKMRVPCRPAKNSSCLLFAPSTRCRADPGVHACLFSLQVPYKTRAAMLAGGNSSKRPLTIPMAHMPEPLSCQSCGTALKSAGNPGHHISGGVQGDRRYNPRHEKRPTF